MTNEEKLTMAVTPKVLEDYHNQKVAPFLNGSGATHYSTEEQVVGTWVDGSKVYQKTITATLPDTSTNGVETTNTVDIGTTVVLILNICSVFYTNTGSFLPVPHTTFGDPIRGARIVINNKNYTSQDNRNKILIKNSNTGWNGCPIIITIEYTKS